MTIQLYNVLSKKKEPFLPIEEKEVRIYVCGVTVYGRCHVGHLRCYLSFDAILRYFQYKGYKLRYVRNFTDIDDKIIKRADEIAQGPDGEWKKEQAYEQYDSFQWKERLEEDERILELAKAGGRHLSEVVADYFINIFRTEDFGPFELLEPESEPRVSEHIPQVIGLIEKIVERGFAYEAGGDVYFDVPAYHRATGGYGKLSGRDYTQLVEGARVEPSEKKRSAPDFALWKSANPGEPKWDSPWGPGRPGWHIECSAMSADKLGQPFDIHGGGMDLIFPHHENEIAQSEAAAGIGFCNAWIHNGFVTVDGVKMSKSLGNFISIKDALDIALPEVWRLLVLGTHYAKPIDFSRTRRVDGAKCEQVRGTIDIAFCRLEYFYETLNRVDEVLNQEKQQGSAGEAKESGEAKTFPLIQLFEEAMDDDFNTARALAAVGEAMRQLNELCDLKAKEVKKFEGGRGGWLLAIGKMASELKVVLGVLGLCSKEPKDALAAIKDFTVKCRGLDCAAVERKIAQRNEARAAKDWAKADALREELKGMGVELRDAACGTEWKVLR